jgi:hypothetical protein
MATFRRIDGTAGMHEPMPAGIHKKISSAETK